MKILYVQYANPGAYPPLEHSSRILASAGAKIMFLGIGSLGADALRFPPHENIEVRQWKYCSPGWRQKLHYILFGLWGAWTALRWQPDWIYASDPLSCPLALLLSCFSGWRVLYHEHDSPAEGRGARGEDAGQGAGTSKFMRLVLWSRRKLACRAALCLLPNERRAGHFKGETGTLRPVMCIWNCPRREEAETLPVLRRQDKFVLFFHGSIVPARVPLSVVRALKALPGHVCLRIAGYETIGHRGYIRELEEEAKRAGLFDRVEFLGALPRFDSMPQCRLANVGLSFMPKASFDLNETAMTGASNKPFDYLACGAALLVSDLAEWREVFVEPGYGLACDPADPSSIAEALRWFIEHPEETRSMGERGRARILEEWNYETQFKPVLDCILAG